MSALHETGGSGETAETRADDENLHDLSRPARSSGRGTRRHDASMHRFDRMCLEMSTFIL
jgi:hypothetical protein